MDSAPPVVTLPDKLLFTPASDPEPLNLPPAWLEMVTDEMSVRSLFTQGGKKRRPNPKKGEPLY